MNFFNLVADVHKSHCNAVSSTKYSSKAHTVTCAMNRANLNLEIIFFIASMKKYVKKNFQQSNLLYLGKGMLQYLKKQWLKLKHKSLFMYSLQ